MTGRLRFRRGKALTPAGAENQDRNGGFLIFSRLSGRLRRSARGAVPALAALFWLLPLYGAWGQSGSDVTFDPEKPATPAYRDAIEAGDAAREREALERGESFSPTFSQPTRPAGPAPETIPAAAPPKAEVPAPDVPAVVAAPEAPGRAEPPSASEPQSASDPAAAPYRERLPERGGRRDRGGDRDAASPIDALLEVLSEPPGKVTWLDYARDRSEPDGAGAEAQARAAPLPAQLAGLRVGRGLYARTLYEANSDWPGPVVLEILEPPLAGAVATGAFEEASERLVIRIDRLSVGAESWAVEGWAVDPGCACYGIPGRVDRHWFQRVLLPSALAFAEGFLDAAARTARVVTRDATGASITVESGAPSHRQQVYAGAAEAARRAGSVLLESVPSGPTVRVPRNTELVLVVTSPPQPERRGSTAPPRADAAGRSGRAAPAAVIGAGPGAFAVPNAGSAPNVGPVPARGAPQ